VVADQPGPRPSGRPKRRPFRQEQILDVAIELFYECGYHGAGMDKIGAAAGITGPAIYRHFKSKDEILSAALERVASQVIGRAQAIAEAGGDPRDTLEALIENFVSSILDKPAPAELFLYERRVFPEATRQGFDRIHRLHVAEWVHVVSQLQPALNEEEAQLMVAAAMGLLGAVLSYQSGLPRPQLDRLLRAMAMAALVGSGEWAVSQEVGVVGGADRGTHLGQDQRGDVILAAAARLFARKGFAATGIDEIGAAAGISGPGVYRYFSSKDEVLKSLMDRAGHRLLTAQTSPLESTSPPMETLAAMVDKMVAETVEDPALSVIMWTEQRHFTPETRIWIRRIHRLRAAEWAHVLSRILPERSDLELLTIVDGMYGLIRLGAFSAVSLDPDRSKAILTDMALRTLLPRGYEG
jgi:AcrR family transcriptional regulator